jgi:hypothetical protein
MMASRNVMTILIPAFVLNPGKILTQNKLSLQGISANYYFFCKYRYSSYLRANCEDDLQALWFLIAVVMHRTQALESKFWAEVLIV